MHVTLVARLLPLLLAPLVAAQQPGGEGAPPARAQQPDALVKAFVEADGGRGAIAAAAAHVLANGQPSRTKLASAVRAIAAVAPKAEPPKSEPAPAPGGAAEGAPAKPADLPEATKKLMTSVVSGDADAAKAALEQLAADKESGAAALQRLDERGRAILHRCLVLTVRRKMDTNAVFAGQYDELRDFQPEAGELLLGWAHTPPKDVAKADEFRVACVRAVRDVLPADQATDETKKKLREIVGKAQHANNQPMFLAAVCALHQYGDASLFDQIKGTVEKQVGSEKPEERVGAVSMLAELHYQARDYEAAANYYKDAIGVLEGQTPAPQGLPTTIYNAACCLALAKKIDESFQYLEKALQTGEKSRALAKSMIDADHDMNNLRGDPRFAQLMEKHFSKPAGAPK